MHQKIRWYVALPLSIISYLAAKYGISYQSTGDFPGGLQILGMALTVFSAAMLIIAIIDIIKTLSNKSNSRPNNYH